MAPGWKEDRTKYRLGSMAQLPARQLEAVSLRHLDGMGNPEISEIVDLSVEAVKRLIFTRKRKLSDFLKSQISESNYANS